MAVGEALKEHRREVEEESESDEFKTEDDSDDDPSFDILEETRSELSKLSLKKPRATRCKDVSSRICKDVYADLCESEREAVVEEIPKLDEKEEKSFEMVEQLIKGGHLQKLKVDQCKIYLRKFGLRLTGNKGILISRISEHQEIVDGCGEKKYPPENFVLNCKGDACLGDVVMFEQNVYEMYNIASRSATGPPCGTRTIAGRIIKESYGAAKQQHTFTIEVLWSKGEKPWPPLHQLLIKGRNLYRIKTTRQRWANEGERSKVLQEKHGRGSRARYSREIRIQEKDKTNKGIKIKRKILANDHIPADKENQHTRKTDGSILQQSFPSILGKPKTASEQHTRKTDGSILQQSFPSILGKPKTASEHYRTHVSSPQAPKSRDFQHIKHHHHQAMPQSKPHGFQQPLQSIMEKPKTAKECSSSAQAKSSENQSGANSQALNNVVNTYYGHQNHYYKEKHHKFDGGGGLQYKNYSHQMHQASWANHFIQVPMLQQYPGYQRQSMHFSNQRKWYAETL